MKPTRRKIAAPAGPVIRTFSLAILVVMSNCQQDSEYVGLINQLRQDPLLTTMEQTTSSDFAIISPELLDSAMHRNQSYRLALSGLEQKRLNDRQRRQLDSLGQALSQQALNWRQYQRDPSVYNLGGEVRRLLKREELPLQERLHAIHQCLQKAAAYYHSAKANIKWASPEKAQLAAQKQLLGLRLITEELPDSVRRAALPSPLEQQLMDTADEARLQLKDYLAFCESLWFEHQDSLWRNDLKVSSNDSDFGASR